MDKIILLKVVCFMYRTVGSIFSFMVRKLYTFACGGCDAENPDSPMNQDVLTSGCVYLAVLKVSGKNSFRSASELD